MGAPLTTLPALRFWRLGDRCFKWPARCRPIWSCATIMLIFDGLEGRAGLATCGLLDFQDAVVGPVTSDIVSLLQDSRRDVDRAVAADLIAGYLARHPDVAPDNFAASYAILRSASLKCWAFLRASHGPRQSDLLGHMPRIWRYIEEDLAVPELTSIRDFLAQVCRPNALPWRHRHDRGRLPPGRWCSPPAAANACGH